MRIDFTIGIYQARRDGQAAWHGLVPVRYNAYISGDGDGEAKLRERMLTRLRDVLRSARPVDHEQFQLPLGTELMRVPIDVKLPHTRAHGLLPLIVEPRWVAADRQRLLCYHPNRRSEWFLADDRDEIAAIAPAFIREHWAEVTDTTWLMSNGNDRLVPLALSTEPGSLLDQLPSRKKDHRTAAGASRQGRVLARLGIDETAKIAAGQAKLGVPRSPHRERLAYLLGGAKPRSACVVGPPGTGKTTLLRRWIADRLAEDGYGIHKNLDRVHHVWRVSGKRMIAGMSYLGQWEERCLAVLAEARTYRGILWFEDLHLFGRLGQSQQSERSFADFFRGPVRRGELAIVAELTAEQFARLERDAPGLAEALALVAVPAASAAETATLLLHELRAIETELPVAMHPFVARTALELGAALFPWRARPGVAIEIVRRVATDAHARGITRELTPADVLEQLARTTGLSSKLLALDQPLDAADVEAAFAARVIGQPVATRIAADVILRVRAGLADPGRPIGTLLFTGPTGTGKTELATAIAEYLYGDQTRLVRIDMGELSGPDAVARLIGDRWQPDGLLTSRVRAQPFCVVLLDEIEKAHPRVLHLLLQLFDEGRLTDAAGEVASFASAVVIMTSNLGSRTAAPIGFGDARDRILADVAKAVREFFPVELFNRIDQVVPFAPLTPEVAAKVVDKELAKLLARRGLRERNTFVYAGAAVRRRAVSDAFDPRYGARTVKRWLEDRIGGALTDLLATAPPARLRIVRLSEHRGEIVASLEPMIERTPIAGPYVLDGALDVATAALEPAIAIAAAAVARIRRDPALAAAREAATGELRYYVDELDQRLTALTELLGVSAAAPAVPATVVLAELSSVEHEHEPTYEQHLEQTPGSHGHERRVRVRGSGRGRPTRPPAGRDALLAGIAEALLLARALPGLLDPDAHAITIVLGRIGASDAAHGLLIAATALAQPAWLDDLAWIDNPSAPGATAELRRATSAVDLTVLGNAQDIVLVLRGLFVRDALAGDHGTWMIRAAASEPDVIRVELRAGAAAPAVDVLRAHLAARRELERVLEVGGALPANPDVLLPVTRTLAYRAPLRLGEPIAVELEDFSTGWGDRGTAKDLSAAIRRAWHLAWSRQVPT